MKDILRLAIEVKLIETEPKTNTEQLFQDLMIYGISVSNSKGESVTKDYILNPDKYMKVSEEDVSLTNTNLTDYINQIENNNENTIL